MIAHISHNHTTGGGVLFFELVFFLLHWKRVILARFGYFFSSLHTFCVFFTSLDIVIVNLNGQIWGMGLTMSNSLLYRDGITGLMKAITREENQVWDGTLVQSQVLPSDHHWFCDNLTMAMWSQVVEMLLADPRTNVNLCSQAAGLTVRFPHDIILWTNLTMICFFKQFSAPKYRNNIFSFTFFSASAHCLCHWELRSCANDSRQARSHLTQLEVWRMFFQRWCWKNLNFIW